MARRKLQLVEYTPEVRERWEDFVLGSNNGTIFHLQRFLDYHPSGRFVDHHLVFQRGGKVVSLFPAVLIEKKNRILSSHAGASYGGFVMGRDVGLRDITEMVALLIDHCIERDMGEIRLTPPPSIYYNCPTNYLDFALLKRGFLYDRRELTSVISVENGDLLATFKNEARTAVRKAIRSGVTVDLSEKYDGFYQILKKNLKMRHNVTPTHTLEELLRLKQLLPERIWLFSASMEGKQIAGVVVFVCNPRVILAFYISHDEEYQEYRAVNLLIYHILRWARDRGFDYLDLGTFTLNMEPNWGLGRFKESLGAVGRFRDTYLLRLFHE